MLKESVCHSKLYSSLGVSLPTRIVRINWADARRIVRNTYIVNTFPIFRRISVPCNFLESSDEPLYLGIH